MTLSQLKDFHLDHLFSVLLPFWMRDGVDREHGAFYTCFNNAGDRLASTNKYIWSQGRFLWMVSRFAWAFPERLGTKGLAEAREAARRGAEFLMAHALLPNGNSAWVLDAEGKPILTDRKGGLLPVKPGDRLDLGITADQFLVYGMAEYARMADDRKAYDFALRLFDSVQRRLASGDFLTFPHDTPAGFRSHGKPMIMVETAQELADVAVHFRDPAAFRLIETARASMREVLDVFVRPEHRRIFELVRTDGSLAVEQMLGSYYNPGHSLEDAWFLMHLARRLGDPKPVAAATEVVRWMAADGWDSESGGLPQFQHIEGGQPRGTVRRENDGDHMIRELTENWSNRLWWVHSEALYALILSYEHTKDPWFLDTYWKYHEYVFRTFPNPDGKVGEWIQIRDRKGVPEDKVVALPVKDPYHITRALMLLVKCLERMGA